MAQNSVVRSHPTLVLVHPNRLFSECLASLLRDTPYAAALNLASFDGVQLQACQLESKLVFLVGGRTAAQIAETVRTIRTRLPSACIIVIGATSGPNEVISAFEAGADVWRLPVPARVPSG